MSIKLNLGILVLFLAHLIPHFAIWGCDPAGLLQSTKPLNPEIQENIPNREFAPEIKTKNKQPNDYYFVFFWYFSRIFKGERGVGDFVFRIFGILGFL